MIGAAIRVELLTRAETRKLLAGVEDQYDRVFPLVIPEKVGNQPQMPCTVYQLVAVERQQTYCGVSDLVRTRWSLDHYSPDYDQAWLVARAVEGVLQDFRGMLGGTIDCRNATLEAALDLQDIEPGLYRVSQSWAFWHAEK